MNKRGRGRPKKKKAGGDNIQSRNWEFYFDQGKSFFDAGDYSNARREFKKAIEEGEEESLSSDLYSYYGESMFQEGDYDDAIECFEKAMELVGYEKPPKTKAGLYIDLGESYMGLNKVRNAIKSYKKAIDLNCGDLESYHNLIGLAYVRIKKYEKAIQHYDKAVRFFGKLNCENQVNLANFIYNRCEAKELMNDVVGAIEDLELCMGKYEHDSNDLYQCHKKGLSLYKLFSRNDGSRLKDCLTCVNYMVNKIHTSDEIDDDDEEEMRIKYITERSSILIELQKYTACINDINEVMKYLQEVDSDNDGIYRLYRRRGCCFAHLFQFQNALSDFNSSIERKPSLRAYELRAKAYAQFQEHDKSLVDITAAINGLERRLKKSRNADNLNQSFDFRIYRANIYFLKNMFEECCNDVIFEFLRCEPEEREKVYFKYYESMMTIGESLVDDAEVPPALKLTLGERVFKTLADYLPAESFDFYLPKDFRWNVYLQLGKVFEKKGDLQQAIVQYGKSIHTYNRKDEPYDLRSMCLYKENEPEKAADDLKILVGRDPLNSEYQRRLSHCYMKLGDRRRTFYHIRRCNPRATVPELNTRDLVIDYIKTEIPNGSKILEKYADILQETTEGDGDPNNIHFGASNEVLLDFVMIETAKTILEDPIEQYRVFVESLLRFPNYARFFEELFLGDFEDDDYEERIKMMCKPENNFFKDSAEVQLIWKKEGTRGRGRRKKGQVTVVKRVVSIPKYLLPEQHHNKKVIVLESSSKENLWRHLECEFVMAILFGIFPRINGEEARESYPMKFVAAVELFRLLGMKDLVYVLCNDELKKLGTVEASIITSSSFHNFEKSGSLPNNSGHSRRMRDEDEEEEEEEEDTFMREFKKLENENDENFEFQNILTLACFNLLYERVGEITSNPNLLEILSRFGYYGVLKNHTVVGLLTHNFFQDSEQFESLKSCKDVFLRKLQKLANNFTHSNVILMGEKDNNMGRVFEAHMEVMIIRSRFFFKMVEYNISRGLVTPNEIEIEGLNSDVVQYILEFAYCNTGQDYVTRNRLNLVDVTDLTNFCDMYEDRIMMVSAAKALGWKFSLEERKDLEMRLFEVGYKIGELNKLGLRCCIVGHIAELSGFLRNHDRVRSTIVMSTKLRNMMSEKEEMEEDWRRKMSEKEEDWRRKYRKLKKRKRKEKKKKEEEEEEEEEEENDGRKRKRRKKN